MIKITGKVLEWKKLGRTIWFPTANVEIPLNSPFTKGGMGGLEDGTYKINIVISWKIFAWVWAYLNDKKLFEAHIFDFNENIYWKEIEVYLLEKIRENKKFENLDELKQQIQKDVEFTKQNQFNVLTFWTFDVFHEGHKYFLNEAKKFWDKLITIVATDKNVEKIKWFKTHFDQQTRKKEIEKSWISDLILVWSENNPLNWLLLYKPRYICLWYDQRWFSEKLPNFIKENSLKTEIVRIPSFKPEIYKSSILKKYKLQKT